MGSGLFPIRLTPPPHFRSRDKSRLSPVLLTDGCRSGSLHPVLGLSDVLVLLTELRELLSLLDHQLIMQRNNSGTAVEETVGQSPGEAPGTPSPSRCVVLTAPPRVRNSEALWSPCFGGFYGGFIT